MFYLRGRGVKKNVRLAVRWLERSGAQGLGDSLVQLGTLYKSGDDVVQDDARAVRYFQKAADLGHAAGQFLLGEMLIGGRGTEKDPLGALELLDQACAQGYAPALDVQAHMDEFVSFDPAEAGFRGFPVEHPFPVRRRTAIAVSALARPSYQAMARDIYDYVRDNPKDTDAGLKDVAALLAAGADNGQAPLPLFK